MAHLTVRSGYQSLVERLNRFPQGAPASHLLFSILKILFSEREAELVSQLPIQPFSETQAARAWKIEPARAHRILDELAGRGLLLDMVEPDGGTRYVLPPPMAGFFEFSMMRIRTDVDQKALSELLYQYLNTEEDFIRCLFVEGETQLGRVFVQESALPTDNFLEVLDYERASEVIRSASHRALGVCYCRHKMSHLDRACKAPMNICMTFNAPAASLVRHGVARTMEIQEGLDLLEQARDQGLVQFGDNVQRNVAFICNCCGCCCEALIAARRFGLLHPVHTTNFIPDRKVDLCTGCGKCVQACPVEAMSLVSANDPRRPKARKARIHDDLCLGCGVCVSACPRDALFLKSRPERVVTPVDSVHRVVLMAIERGKLQNLIFDNHALLSHRAMAAILGVILRLPPIRQTLASRQLRSRYVEYLLRAYRDGNVQAT